MNMEVLILIIVLSFRRINHMALNHCIDPLSTVAEHNITNSYINALFTQVYFSRHLFYVNSSVCDSLVYKYAVDRIKV